MTADDLTAETAICILACASLIQQRLDKLIEFQNRQIAVLKRLVVDGRHRPTNDERRQLARSARDLDRDPIFIESAKECFRSIGCKVTITPPKSPKCNAYIERPIGTTRREVGRSIIPFSTEALRRTLAEHVDYSNHERTHQTPPNRRMPAPLHGRSAGTDGTVVRRGFLGNTLSSYRREVA
jgi:hypothetical protein